MAEITLAGCAPVPLAAYLKALGVFRLLAEQKDGGVRGWWRNEAFILGTTLRKEDLVRFFLDEYRPSPIISPWNGRAGFLEGEDEESTRSGAELVKMLQDARASRFAALKNAVDAMLGLTSLKTLDEVRSQRKRLESRKKSGRLSTEEMEHLAALKKREEGLKKDLVVELRGTVPDQVVAWMDTCWRIGASEDMAPPAPLLGSGGNDGSRDLGLNFGQQLASLFDFQDPEGACRSQAESTLRPAVFGVAAVGLDRGTMGQFAPAQAGPNAGIGFGAAAPLNPWDSVLSLEGSLLFAGAVTRRLGGTRSESSFPFTVRATGAGGGGGVVSDEREARGEVWAPLWDSPASFAEIAAVFSEGRAILGRYTARDGLDFARAVVSLGVDRGVSSFQRYAFMKREGRNYIAAPLTRIEVRRNFDADRLNDLDRGDWLRPFRDYSRSKDAPARLRSIAERFDEAILAMTKIASPKTVQQVLIAIGEAVSYLASSPKARDPKEGKQKPPPRLSQAWFHAANDGTVEFRIAAALAGLGRGPALEDEAAEDQESPGKEGELGEADETLRPEESAASIPGPVTAFSEEERTTRTPPPPIRAHLAPLEEKSWYARFRQWDENDRLAVCAADALERTLATIVQRRVLFAARRNLVGSPFDARAPADLASILAFLAGETGDPKIAALMQGLAWAEPPTFVHAGPAHPGPLPLAYALIKPFFAPVQQLRELGAVRDGATLPIPTGLVQRLRAGDIGGAVALASRRARASGLPVTFAPGAEETARTDGPRLLASLLVPIRSADLKRCLQRAYPALFDDTELTEPTEEPAHAA